MGMYNNRTSRSLYFVLSWIFMWHNKGSTSVFGYKGSDTYINLMCRYRYSCWTFILRSLDVKLVHTNRKYKNEWTISIYSFYLWFMIFGIFFRWKHAGLEFDAKPTRRYTMEKRGFKKNIRIRHNSHSFVYISTTIHSVCS